MSKFRCSAAIAAVALALAAPLAHALPIVFEAALSGPAEDPPNASPGTGFARVIFDNTAHTMRVIAEFENLVAGVTAAHVHCCTAAPGSGVVGVATTTPTFPGFPSGVTSGSYDQTFDTLDDSTYRAAFITASGGTAAGAEAALLAGLLGGQAYFNIHTTAFGAGEIRGFLQRVPEPATIVLIVAGLLALVVPARRRVATLRR